MFSPPMLPEIVTAAPSRLFDFAKKLSANPAYRSSSLNAKPFRDPLPGGVVGSIRGPPSRVALKLDPVSTSRNVSAISSMVRGLPPGSLEFRRTTDPLRSQSRLPPID